MTAIIPTALILAVISVVVLPIRFGLRSWTIRLLCLLAVIIVVGFLYVLAWDPQ